MNGFYFRGRHSSDFGAVVKSKLRPLLPEEKSVLVSPMMMDGSYDFSAANPWGRPFYMDRIFELSIAVTAADETALSKKVSALGAWLSGRGELIFDDMPSTVWEGAVIAGISFEPRYSGRTAQFTVVVRTRPFSCWILSVQEEPTLGVSLLLGDNVPLAGFSGRFSSALAAGENSVVFDNIGQRPARPKLTFDFSAPVSELAVSFGGYSVSLEDISAQEICLDFEQCTAEGDGDDITGHVGGDFFELPMGESVISVDVPSMGTVKFDWRPQFVYAANFEKETAS